MARTSLGASAIRFVLDEHSVDRDTGIKIDWATVDAARVGADGKKVILAGTFMSKETDGWVPRLDRTAAQPAVGILETDAYEDRASHVLSGYGMILGGVVYENLLPEFGDAAFDAMKGEVETAGVGTGWAWKTYEDSRAA